MIFVIINTAGHFITQEEGLLVDIQLFIFGTLSSCLAMTLTSMEAADATNTRSLDDMNSEIKATH